MKCDKLLLYRMESLDLFLNKKPVDFQAVFGARNIGSYKEPADTGIVRQEWVSSTQKQVKFSAVSYWEQVFLLSAFLRNKAACYDSKKETRKALLAADFSVGLAGWVRGLT